MSTDRGISPVVGVAVMLAIIVALVVLVSTLLLGLADTEPTAPETRLALDEGGDCTDRLVHEQGERLDGTRIELRGAEDPDALAGRSLGAGEAVSVEPASDTVTVVWTGPDGESSHVLGEFDADPAGAGWTCGDGTVYAGDDGDLTVVDADDEALLTLSGPEEIDALGPVTADLTGDGRTDIPYVDDDRLRVTDATNATTTLAGESAIPGDIEGEKTRLAVTRWDGSGPSVFFVNENHDTIYRVASPGGSVTTVATPGNGAQAVVGTGDVDGDGTDELVFADGSQQLRYLEPDGTTKNLDGGQLGSNNGIGAGPTADFDGDGVDRVVGVDGAKDLVLAGEPTSEGGAGTTVVSAVDARKAPPTVADVDGDGEREVVYVSNDSGKLKYLDDPGGANTIHLLTDGDGDFIQRSEETGVV